MDVQKIGFGGGCHWCTEAVFQSLKGVTLVEQGFIRSKPPSDAWSEAVIVSFNSNVIDLDTLINVHVRTHSATKEHHMRHKYRSAIYTLEDQHVNAAVAILNKIQSDFEHNLITQVLPFIEFKLSDDQFQNYYETNPERPFCKRYIDPKLDLIRQKFSSQALA